MFGLLTDADEAKNAFAQVPIWPEKVWLDGEKETLGLYLTGHPINQYLSELRAYTSCKIADLKPTGKEQQAAIAGLVLGVRVMTNKKGRRWGIVTLDDKSGRVDVRLFPDSYEEYEPLLQSDKILFVKGQVSFDEFSDGNTMTVRSLMDITDAREHYIKNIHLVLPDIVQTSITQNLVNILEKYVGGTCPIEVAVEHKELSVTLQPDANWYVTPSDQLIYELKQLLGKQNVVLNFA
jgi:DNA polymerase-3 subunit alpha